MRFLSCFLFLAANSQVFLQSTKKVQFGIKLKCVRDLQIVFSWKVLSRNFHEIFTKFFKYCTIFLCLAQLCHYPKRERDSTVDAFCMLSSRLPFSMRFDSSSMTRVRMMRHDAIGTERRGIYGLSKEADLLWWKGHGIFWLLLVVVLLLLLLGWPSRPSWQKSSGSSYQCLNSIV